MITINIDYLLSVDDFNKVKRLENKDAAINQLIKLLLLDPGSIESFPEMGVGLVSKWRYMESTKLQDLQYEIETQIATYLPLLRNTTISLQMNDNSKILYITISFNNQTVVLSSNLETKEIKLGSL